MRGPEIYLALLCALGPLGESASWAQDVAQRQLTLAAHSRETGVIEAGTNSGTEEFVVGEVDSLRIVVLSADLLDVELLLPGGATLTEANAASLGARFLRFRLEEALRLPAPGLGVGEHVLMVLDSPAAGTYAVRASTPQAVAETTPFLVTVFPESSVRAALAVPEPEVFLGEPAIVTAFVYDGETPITGATVRGWATGDVAGASGALEPPTTFPLLDDGVAPDFAAGDGVYSAAFVPEDTGRHMVVAEIEGTRSDGGAFQRKVTTDVTVSESTSRILSVGGAAGVDADADGLFEALRIPIEVELGDSGTFALLAILREASGRSIAATLRLARTSGGVDTLLLDFPAAAVVSLGSDSPWLLESLRLDRLSSSGTPELQDRSIDAATVSGFTLAQFGGDDPAMADGDLDGVHDLIDNCLDGPNPSQKDADRDGYGNACDADINNDGTVDFLDLGALKSAFFTTDPIADLDGNGVVDFLDLGRMKALFFRSPGPSGLACAGNVPCPEPP